MYKLTFTVQMRYVLGVSGVRVAFAACLWRTHEKESGSWALPPKALHW